MRAARRLLSMAAAYRPSPSSDTVGALLAAGGHSFSFEFFPPKTDAGERALFHAIRELESLRPTFVSDDGEGR